MILVNLMKSDKSDVFCAVLNIFYVVLYFYIFLCI